MIIAAYVFAIIVTALLLYDVGDIVMMKKCMLGIKERAKSQNDKP